MNKPHFLCIAPSDRRLMQSRFPGTRRTIICDSETPTTHLVAGVVELLEPGCIINMHYHSVEELQYIVSGSGVVRDGEGNEYPVSPGTSVYCAPGAQGAHEFQNCGQEPLVILFAFPVPGGHFPQITRVAEREN